MSDEYRITLQDLPIVQGEKGDKVKAVQRLLNRHVATERALRVDGDFGNGTGIAVRVFQARRNLPIDGIVDFSTLWKLYSAPQCEEPDETVSSTPGGSNDAPWMRYALGEYGTRENSRPGQHNSRIVEYHRSTTLADRYAREDETAWCSSFVNWCLERAGYTGTDSAGAASWRSWGRNQSPPKFGTIMMIHNPAAKNTSLSRTGNHVGFFYQNSSRHYVLLGGNQSNRVKVSRFSKSAWQLKGARWPDEQPAGGST